MDKKIKILMVDDERQFRTTTEKILRRKGFDTLMAASGTEAIEKLASDPDVVVLDIKMPGMDGHQTLREIKKRSPHLPVIMLTGHGAMPSAVESKSEGAFDYLTKPCDIDLLSAKIRDAYRIAGTPEKAEEKRIEEIMIPIEAYTTLTGEHTIRDAVSALKTSFASKMSTACIMETGHRSLLVMDSPDEIQGIVAIRDLMDLIMPAYLSSPKPSTADSIQYSPLFWQGMFTQSVIENAAMKIDAVMSPPPPLIDARGNLMEAAYMMVDQNVRRLVVTQGGRAIGVVREQDLFFEMERILGTDTDAHRDPAGSPMSAGHRTLKTAD